MSKSRRLRCPHCGFLDTIRKGTLLINGTWFPNKVCLVLYRDANIKMTILSFTN